MKEISTKQKEPEIVIDNLQDIKCDKCNGVYFKTVIQLKIIPRILDPNLIDDMIKPILKYQCINCDNILQL